MMLMRSHEQPAALPAVRALGRRIENHTIDFRGSADFQEWRKLVAHCWAAPPAVEHVKEIVPGF